MLDKTAQNQAQAWLNQAIDNLGNSQVSRATPQQTNTIPDTNINDQTKESYQDLIHSLLEKLSERDSEITHHRVQQSNTNNLWDKFRDKFHNGPPWFQLFRDKFTLGLNAIGIAFNLLAVIATNSKFFSKKISESIDKKSEWFSKYIIPFSFGWNGIEALVGNRAIEALTRIVPAVSFCFLPFYNLNLATGVSSGLQYLFEHVKDRHGGKHPAPHSMVENAKQVISTSFDVLKDIFTGNRSKEDLAKQIGTLFLLAGSIGGSIFAHKDRDSKSARFFGNMRNIGGIVADWKLIFNDVKDDARRAFDLRFVGGMCSTASILNILMRWVDPALARTLNHIAIALDDFGLTYWAQSSKRDNDAQKNSQPSQAPVKLNLAMPRNRLTSLLAQAV